MAPPRIMKIEALAPFVGADRAWAALVKDVVTHRRALRLRNSVEELYAAREEVAAFFRDEFPDVDRFFDLLARTPEVHAYLASKDVPGLPVLAALCKCETDATSHGSRSRSSASRSSSSGFITSSHSSHPYSEDPDYEPSSGYTSSAGTTISYATSAPSQASRSPSFQGSSRGRDRNATDSEADSVLHYGTETESEASDDSQSRGRGRGSSRGRGHCVSRALAALLLVFLANAALGAILYSAYGQQVRALAAPHALVVRAWAADAAERALPLLEAGLERAQDAQRAALEALARLGLAFVAPADAADDN